MDYKKILKSRELRLKILKFMRFIPDEIMLKIQYKIKLGRNLNLKEPKRFTEKLQWYKLNYRNPLMVQCADKYEVREFVRSRGLEDILVPCLGVYNSFDEIDWEKLPKKFVMKDTLGGGSNSVIIVEDKETVDINNLKKRCEKWVSIDARCKDAGREWPYYSGKPHRIIIDQFIESDEETGDLNDYKFFCFNGECEYLYVTGDRMVGQSVKISLFDREFKRLPVKKIGSEDFTSARKPTNFDEMLKIAEKLAEGFPHVRVDLYDVNGKILFGELTFFATSGYMKYEPDEFDIKIGEKFVLPINNKKEY